MKTIHWSDYFVRNWFWSEVISSAKLSKRWSAFGLGHDRTFVWTMVWFWSNRRSFPSGKVWSETVTSALQATTVFRPLFSLIWSEVTFVWHALVSGHIRMASQPASCFPGSLRNFFFQPWVNWMLKRNEHISFSGKKLHSARFIIFEFWCFLYSSIFHLRSFFSEGAYSRVEFFHPKWS